MKSVFGLLVGLCVLVLLQFAQATHDAVCTDGSQWNNDCNSCFCFEGRAACTQMACAESTGRYPQTCTDGSSWLQDDCNWCHCVKEGVAICTLRACLPAWARRRRTESAVATQVEGAAEAECEASGPTSRWRNLCNWCRCSDDGVAGCTKKLCSSEIVQRLEAQGTKKCEGSPRWRKDCNWCTCKGGAAVCTEKPCGEGAQPDAAAAGTSSEVCRHTGNNLDAWRAECNWCRCNAAGASSCTKLQCTTERMQALKSSPECRNSPQWKKDDCNWCTCDNDVAVCEQNVCQTADTEVRRVPQPGDTCEVTETGDRWRDACNWCRCIRWKGACTRRSCPEGLMQRLAGTKECEGTARWKKDCNWCRCTDKGIGVCDKRACINVADFPQLSRSALSVPEPEVGTDCKKGSEWSESCNNCHCNSGYGFCTKRGCRTPMPDTCKEGAQWKKGCNWCGCDDGRPVCTEQRCPDEASPAQEEEQDDDDEEEEEVAAAPAAPASGRDTCAEGARWLMDACNWCNCANGIGVCTRMACRPGISLTNKIECVEGSSWNVDCKECFCHNGKSVCKEMCTVDRGQTVIPDPSVPQVQPRPTIDRSQPVIPDPSVPQVQPRPTVDRNQRLIEDRPYNPLIGLPRDDRDCVPGSRFTLDGCNWCTCGSTGRGACTQMACFGDRGNKAMCNEGSRWKQDGCNWCDCVDGRRVCTEMFCIPDMPKLPAVAKPEVAEQQKVVEEEECTEGSRWMKDCNWCNCASGKGVCTRRACRPGAKIDGPMCEAGSRWKQDCNWCSCTETGRGICTIMACLAFTAPSAAATAIPRRCNPGSRWKEDCNSCSCPDSGITVCTERDCTTVMSPSDNEPDCEEEAKFMDKEGCNWCFCSNGRIGCTLMLCIHRTIERQEPPVVARAGVARTVAAVPQLAVAAISTGTATAAHRGPEQQPEEEQCADGTSWVDDCNQCMCRKGIAACTRRACFTILDSQPTRDTDEPRCMKSADSGPCFASIRRFRFNSEKNRCEPFLYGGCAGNDNRFTTPEECQQTCGGDDYVMDTSCDRIQCPEYRETDFYKVLGCTPVYEGGSCCAVRFTCQASAVQVEPSQCLYDGVVYEAGDTVPVKHACSRCMCSGSNSELNCANIECPSLFRPRRPGCRGLHRLGECCAYDEECESTDPVQAPEGAAVVRQDTVTCEAGGRTFLNEANMYFENTPCQICVCGPDYTGPFGPGCEKINCGYDFRYTDRIKRGCVALYYKDSCCPISFVCPGDSEVAADQSAANPEGLTEDVCTFGDRTVAVGHALATTVTKITCTCKTPPAVTCVQTEN